MLDPTHEPIPLSEWLAALPCDAVLPPSWDDYFDKRGALDSRDGDPRRFPRFHARSKAALECRQSLPSRPRRDAWIGVYTKDVSRGGLSLLHSEQLFPGERMRVVLADGVARRLEVVHCRRIQRRCFEIGAKFIAAGVGASDQTEDKPTGGACDAPCVR